MKKVWLGFTVAALFYSCAATAQNMEPDPIEKWICPVELEFDYPVDFAPVYEKKCVNGEAFAASCYDFSIYAAGHPKLAWTFKGSGIGSKPEYPPELNRAIVDFRPISYSALHSRRADGIIEVMWLIGLIDSSGSPSRSEERFVVLNGEFKAVSPIMTMQEYGAFSKKLNLALPVETLSFKCNKAT